ncbi:MAG: hypothetical protein GKS06_01290 [Acidobacteria bacterium]|nr:hypothetical protein [Acidobacteriota bacterium]
MAPIEVDAAHFSADTRNFVRHLHEFEVKYVVVGGEAVIFHGYVRLTGDVDFFIANDPDNARRLYSALEKFWEGDVPGIASPAELTAVDLIVQFGMPPNRIDIMTSVAGVDFNEAWAGRVPAVMVDGEQRTPIPYLGVEALIKNKRAAGRPKDLDDLEHLDSAE